MKTLFAALALLVLTACQGGPKVLIIGDSISLGYTPFVSVPYADVTHNGPCFTQPYQHYSDDTNAEGSEHQANCIKQWLTGGPYNVVHFNAGIWDVDTCTPLLNRSLSDYLMDLQRELDAIRQSGAVPVFATTTPVSPTSGCVDNAKVVEYNAAAVAMMQSQGVQIDDLYSTILPYNLTYHVPSGIHWTDAGYQIMAQQVSQSIVHALTN